MTVFALLLFAVGIGYLVWCGTGSLLKAVAAGAFFPLLSVILSAIIFGIAARHGITTGLPSGMVVMIVAVVMFLAAVIVMEKRSNGI